MKPNWQALTDRYLERRAKKNRPRKGGKFVTGRYADERRKGNIANDNQIGK